MKKKGDNTASIELFWALLKAGLWEQDFELWQYESFDFAEIQRIAEEQSVVGVVTAGLDHAKDIKMPLEWSLQFIGSTLQIEQRNILMNEFIAIWIKKLQNFNVHPILIKGQGIAQAYERPLWRACGDVDLLIASSEYEHVKSLLKAFTSTEPKETESTKEYCLKIAGWSVEVHGTLHCRLTKRLDNFLNRIQDDCCCGGVRVWRDGEIDVFLPSVDNDVFVIFTHIVKHFFREGVGLRQLCDWCRLLWVYRDVIDANLLERRLRESGLMTEWKAFAAFSVDWLGMPVEAMPMYSPSKIWARKAARISAFILETGNFGHNKDLSYLNKASFIVRKTVSLCRHTWDLTRQFFIFPMDSVRVWWSMVKIGVNRLGTVANC